MSAPPGSEPLAAAGNLVGLVLATAATRLGRDATAVLSRLAGSLGDAARRAATELAALDEAARKRRRAELAAQVRTPTVATARGVHPTWIEASLVELPARARTALAGEAHDPIDVWLARWALASLPPATDPRSPDVLVAWLRAVALDQLAFALGPQSSSPAAPAPLREAAARITVPPRANALGPHRAAIVRCRGATLADEHSLLAIAARALAPHLASQPLVRLALTRRLPYAEGSLVDRELVAHAATPVDQVPAWAALVAA